MEKFTKIVPTRNDRLFEKKILNFLNKRIFVLDRGNVIPIENRTLRLKFMILTDLSKNKYRSIYHKTVILCKILGILL